MYAIELNAGLSGEARVQAGDVIGIPDAIVAEDQ